MKRPLVPKLTNSLDPESWVILTLTPRGEKESPDALVQAARRALKGLEVYVPAVETQVGDDRITHRLLEGYVFIRRGTRSDRELKRLENTKYFEEFLSLSGKLSCTTQAEIDTMREQIRIQVNQGIGVSDTVEICTGPYKGLFATVTDDIPELKSVVVSVTLRSKAALLTFERNSLKVVDQAPLSLYSSRLGYLKAWGKMAKPLLHYRLNVNHLQRAYDRYRFLVDSAQRGSLLHHFVHAYPKRGHDFMSEAYRALERRLGQLKQLHTWARKGSQLYQFIHFKGSEPLRDRLESAYLEYAWLVDVERRLSRLGREVEDLHKTLEKRNKVGEDIVENLIVDGLNLAFRCHHAPGLSNLSDSQGRPTGMVVGFLRSLAAFKKRYPEAHVWVAWDGSSKRRKDRYADYKSKRPERVETSGFNPISTLREILPSLGVSQAWNPNEEADDVIATLVRQALPEKRNLIFSMDRDFLQLVTENTKYLYPAVGARKEILYDRNRVIELWGVPPEQIVQLRALLGDKSDNLPGVVRVPKKVLKILLKEYGSIGGLFASNLSGVSKMQYERLRAAEPQVKINRDLMSLEDVEFFRIDPDVDPEGAAERLQGLDIKPEPLLEAFFPGGLRES